MGKEKIPRLDGYNEIKEKILPCCRLRPGEIWEDPVRGHRVGCLDAADVSGISKLMNGKRAVLSIQDPPYNVVVGSSNTGGLGKISSEGYIEWSRKWVWNAVNVLADDSHFYVWLGADQNDGFQPLPDFMIMMRSFSGLSARSFITMRNQRGYGTQKNWMAVRQELLYYIKGKPEFNVDAEYTDIPKILKGYYKKVGGVMTENFQRSKSEFIRAGNVWVDIQQVFYRMEENVPGCYAQKPLKAVERIISSGSNEGDLVTDYFSHAGTTLTACERLNRICYTSDIDPVFSELTIRRLERLREKGKAGWQFENPFPEVHIEIPAGEDEDDNGG
jgi:DNA modification methylase